MLFPQTNAIRLCTSLNGLWHWSIPESVEHGCKAGLIAVPGRLHDHPDLKDYIGPIKLHSTFQVNALQLQQRLVLYFESVSQNALVYVNGSPVMSCDFAYLPYEAPINDLVNVGQNLLSVYLSNVPDELTCPPGKSNPNFNSSFPIGYHPKTAVAGGIDGNVYLYSSNWTFIDDISYQFNNDDKRSCLNCFADILGDDAEINWYLNDSSGTSFAQKQGNQTSLPLPTDWSKLSDKWELELQIMKNNLPIDHYLQVFKPIYNAIQEDSAVCFPHFHRPLTIQDLQTYIPHPSGLYLLEQEPQIKSLLDFFSQHRAGVIVSLPPINSSFHNAEHLHARKAMLARYIQVFRSHCAIAAWGFGLGSNFLKNEELIKLKGIISKYDPLKRPFMTYDENEGYLYHHLDKRKYMTIKEMPLA